MPKIEAKLDESDVRQLVADHYGVKLEAVSVNVTNGVVDHFYGPQPPSFQIIVDLGDGRKVGHVS